jgi:hypothetical protein
LIEQTPNATRVPITTAELKPAIAAEVNTAPGCEAFVGVVIRSATPKSRLDVNWVLRTDEIEAVDKWRARQRPIPNLSESIRKLIEIGLKAEMLAAPAPDPTDAGADSEHAHRTE